MSKDNKSDPTLDPKDMGYWEGLVKTYPSAGDTIQYDPDSPYEELRNRNSILHLVVLGFYSVSSQIDVVRLLLDHGANPNIKNGNGETPLHIVCQGTMRDPEIAELLLGRGADPNALTSDGMRPSDFLGDQDRFSREIRAMLDHA